MPPEIEVGDYVRVQDVHTVVSVLYPTARIARVVDIEDGHVYFELTNGMSLRVAETVRPIRAMKGVFPRGF
jgi:hypothetical protein